MSLLWEWGIKLLGVSFARTVLNSVPEAFRKSTGKKTKASDIKIMIFRLSFSIRNYGH